MNKLRMRFSKTGRAIYISHLDLMATMQRAFSRAGSRLKYSEGFNPRPQISIALPLSVGCSSVCELMDFQLLEEQVDITTLKDRLNATMPEGIEVQEIYEPTRKNAELKWLRIEGVFEYDDRPVDIMLAQLQDFFSRESIVIEKKTKRGFGEMDIRPAIREISFGSTEEGVLVGALISAQNPTLNPDLLPAALRALAPDIAPDFAKFTRVETFDAEMKIFR